MRNKECLFECGAAGSGGGCASLRSNATVFTAGPLKVKGLKVRTHNVSQDPNPSAACLNKPASGPHASASTLHAVASGSHAPASTLHAPASALHAVTSSSHVSASGPHASASTLNADASGPHASALTLHASASNPHASSSTLHESASKPDITGKRYYFPGFSYKNHSSVCIEKEHKIYKFNTTGGQNDCNRW